MQNFNIKERSYAMYLKNKQQVNIPVIKNNAKLYSLSSALFNTSS